MLFSLFLEGSPKNLFAEIKIESRLSKIVVWNWTIVSEEKYRDLFRYVRSQQAYFNLNKKFEIYLCDM